MTFTARHSLVRALRRFERAALASSWAGAAFILACCALVWGLGE